MRDILSRQDLTAMSGLFFSRVNGVARQVFEKNSVMALNCENNRSFERPNMHPCVSCLVGVPTYRELAKCIWGK